MKKRNENLNKFSLKDFYKPSSFYYPGYFWIWNDLITPETLIEQLRDMHKHKALSVCPLPEPAEFRPQIMNTLMKPDYLTKEYFKLYKLVAKEAHRLNMDVWLYDEGGWPSGSACGKVVKSDPTLVKQVLCRKGNIFSVERMISRSTGDLYHPPYPDLLRPAATKKFIELTHERYKKAVGKYFGITITRTFTDEPAVTCIIPGKEIPWTDDLAEEFYRLKDYDLLKHLPALFTEPHKINSVKDMQARIDFFDVWSRRFAQAYLGQIRKWCQKNSLLSGGHLYGDDETLGSVKYNCGHILRAMRQLDIPGIDAVEQQIFPGKINHHFPKYASTAAHQQNKPWAFTESFCVYGNGLTLEQIRWITNYQYVRGINLMVVGCYPLSTRDHFMAGERPHFGPVNPLWRYMENYHTSTARVGYLMSLGKPMIKEAVYYPVRDFWAGGSKMEKKAKANDELVKLLLENQCDFDFIDDDILESSSSKIVDGALKVGNMHYETIWTSQAEWISRKSMKKLALLVSKGGSVKSLYSIPKSGGAKGRSFNSFLKYYCGDKLRGKFNIISSTKGISNHLNPLVKVRPKCSCLHICARSLKNGSLYFVTNEGKKEIKVTLLFKEKCTVMQLDPETGKCWRRSDVSYENGICYVPLHLPFAGSCIFLFTKEELPLSGAPLQSGSVLLTLTDGWRCHRIKSYEIRKHNFAIRDVQEKVLPIQLGDWRKTLGKGFSGDVEYILSFNCPGDVMKQAALLDLGDVCYASEIILNGRNLGKKAWRPFLFPIRAMIKKGTNKLQVIVTNTLANQLSLLKVPINRLKRKNSGWQLGPYHKIAVKFEMSSRPSGLFGPVRILSAKKSDHIS